MNNELNATVPLGWLYVKYCSNKKILLLISSNTMTFEIYVWRQGEGTHTTFEIYQTFFMHIPQPSNYFYQLIASQLLIGLANQLLIMITRNYFKTLLISDWYWYNAPMFSWAYHMILHTSTSRCTKSHLMAESKHKQFLLPPRNKIISAY